MRALLLDLDRTLVDLQSFTDYSAALNDVTELVGSFSDVDVPATDWDSATSACMSVLHSLAGDSRWQSVSDAIASHEHRAIPESVIMPGVVEILPILRRTRTAVVTLLPADVAAAVLARHGIHSGPDHEIDVIVGRDGSIPPKPNPDGLWRACERLGVERATATMIGDSSWAFQAADAAGIVFIGVPQSDGALPEQCVTENTIDHAVSSALDAG